MREKCFSFLINFIYPLIPGAEVGWRSADVKS
jgi:hypothetical protein